MPAPNMKLIREDTLYGGDAWWKDSAAERVFVTVEGGGVNGGRNECMFTAGSLRSIETVVGAETMGGRRFISFADYVRAYRGDEGLGELPGRVTVRQLAELPKMPWWRFWR